MPRLTIDNREMDAPDETTVLEAARALGIDIPTLCHRAGCEPQTSCLVCVVKINGNARLAPACATKVSEGMCVESESDEVRLARRTALELLLSDHLGDCLAPCFFTCPAEMDIPVMLRQIASGDLSGAIATVKRDIALPAILGRICPAPCEKACRRNGLDAAVSICLLKRFVADVDLASPHPYRPVCGEATGKNVAIVGGGPTGLAAAYYLAQAGHRCGIYEQSDRLGGRLWTETNEDNLPRDIVEAEIAQLRKIGIDVFTNSPVKTAEAFQLLCKKHDAVFLAPGASASELASVWGLPTTSRGLAVNKETYQTDMVKVFAGGNAIRGKGMVVRSVADGKEAAMAIDSFLLGEKFVGPQKLFSTKIGRMEREELILFAEGSEKEPRREPAGGKKNGFDAGEATLQAARCLHCDCRGLHNCKLRHYAVEYEADPKRFQGARRAFIQDARHAEVIFESGKCIDCGLCIQIAAKSGEKLGLTFLGRGFDVRVAVPFDGTLDEALLRVAVECVEACPTAALSFKRDWSDGE